MRSPLRPSPPRRGTRLVLILLPLGVALACIGWLTYQAMVITHHLEAALESADSAQELVDSQDLDAAASKLTGMKIHTSEARAAATDPLWRAFGTLPWIGDNFSAVSKVSIAADTSVNAIEPLLLALNGTRMDTILTNGKVDIEAIKEIAPHLSRASSDTKAAYDTLKGIESSSLVPQISRPLKSATTTLGILASSVDGASSATAVLPDMLGASGERSYLVLVQNNAEIRATGGIPGALVVLKTRDGQIEFTDHGSASALGRFKPPLAVDEEQERIYTTRLGGYMQNVNLTPDFPTAASTAQAMWEKENPNTKIDGVIALDAVVLSRLLVATGPVELSSLDSLPLGTGDLPTTLNSENVVQTLLSDVYREIEEPQVQDAYFAAVASDIFAALTDGSTDPVQMLKAVQQSAEDQRLFVWSEFEDEQEVMSASTLGGSIVTEEPTIGVYFNDGTGAKMDYYVEREVQLIERCEPDGYYRYAVQATLANKAPLDAAQVLPEYVTGGGNFGVSPGTVRTNVYAYGPLEWLLESASVDGKKSSFGSYRHADSPVAGLTVSLEPGESTTVEFEFSTLYETVEPQLRVTPTVQPRSEMVITAKSGPDCSS